MGCQLQGSPNDCEPDWLVCAFGACVEFFARMTHVKNPDPTTDLVFDRIEMVNRSIYLAPLAGKTLSQSAKAIQVAAGQAAGASAAGAAVTAADFLRLEIWSRRSNTRVAIVGEFDSTQIRFAATRSRRLPRPDAGARARAARRSLEVRATWGIGTGRAIASATATATAYPTPSTTAFSGANPLGRDADGDGYGNACDADLDGDLRVTRADVVPYARVGAPTSRCGGRCACERHDDPEEACPRPSQAARSRGRSAGAALSRNGSTTMTTSTPPTSPLPAPRSAASRPVGRDWRIGAAAAAGRGSRAPVCSRQGADREAEDHDRRPRRRARPFSS